MPPPMAPQSILMTSSFRRCHRLPPPLQPLRRPLPAPRHLRLPKLLMLEPLTRDPRLPRFPAGLRPKTLMRVESMWLTRGRPAPVRGLPPIEARNAPDWRPARIRGLAMIWAGLRQGIG